MPATLNEGKTDGYILLANAIVKQAAEDYWRLKAGLPAMPVCGPPHPRIKEIQRFFCSDSYEILTDLSLDYLIGELNRQVERMELKYEVRKTGNKYAVYRLEDDAVMTPPLSRQVATQKAVELQGVSSLDYPWCVKKYRKGKSRHVYPQ